MMNVYEINVEGFDPDSARKILNKESKALAKLRANFKIVAYPIDHHNFRSMFGRSMQSYLIELLAPQKPIYKRRSLN